MDIDFLLFLQKFRDASNHIWDDLMLYITTYGEELLVVLIASAVYWCLDKRQGVFTFLTLGAGRMVNGALKITACVYRPWIRDARIKPVSGALNTATGYSFPSGHTTNATAVYGTCALYKNNSRILRVLLIATVILIGFSRNYLGVHTPQDVLVAIAITAVIICVMKFVCKYIEAGKNHDVIVYGIFAVLSILLIVYASRKNYPVDYDVKGNVIVDPVKMAKEAYGCAGTCLGIFTGWILERRLVRFETDGTWQQKLARFIIGALGYIVIVYALTKLLPSDYIGAVLGKFIRFFYVLFVVPLFIRIFCKRNSL